MVIVVGIAVLALLSLSVLVSVLFFRLRSVTRKTGAILARIPGKIVISDIHRNLLFIHSGDLTCDNSTAKLKLDALPAFNREQIFQPLQRVFSIGKPERFECDFDGRRYSIELVKISSEVFGVEAVLWGMNDIDECHRIRLRLDASWLVRKDYLRAFGDGKTAAQWHFFFSLASAAAWKEDLVRYPFDETMHYSEDAEWAHRRNGRIVYAPDARVEHSHNYTDAELRKRFYGEGYADAGIFGHAPGLFQTLARAAMETCRDCRFLLFHPHGWIELPAAPRRRLIQKFYFRKGARDYLRASTHA